MTNIIIVEDDPMISEIYQKKFSDSGFHVMAAESGEQALVLAKKEKVDVMLLDLIMPKMNGFEVIQAIRSGGYDENIKIIVFSNLNQREDHEKAIKLGADGFILKADYTPSALVKEVERLMDQYREGEKNSLRMSGDESVVDKNTAGKRILIVEDENIFIEMFGDKLKQDGYEVEAANNGAWGLKEALSKKFDIFIVDMIMPALTGDEIVARLKMEDSTKNIPIIVLSASVDSEVEKKVLALGADAFYVKTQIIPSQLSKKVAELLSRKPSE
ncbi:MAG: response regulator [Candidatus Pacebacteria bacterium]|nr:response regulator [Candidatus Paceibacterota bacterium]MDR3583561.1 response regulator [Candidatus Paceibacterota bacterium]